MRDKVTDEELEKMAEQMTPESFNERYLCDFATQPAPSPASVQSADELLVYIVKSAFSKFMLDATKGEVAVAIDGEAIKTHIAEQLFAQRQIGREEEKADRRELIEHCAAIAVDYMEGVDSWDGTTADSGYLRQHIIDEALSDLDTKGVQDDN
jgi:hypothetical protein